MRPKAPCRQEDGTDCPDRAVGCQGACEKYRAFRAELDKINAERQKEYVGMEYAHSAIWRKRSSLKNSDAGKRALSQR